MSKIDKEKEKITTLRFWLGIAVATLLAIVGWSITNVARLESWLVILSLLAVICLAVVIILLTRQINKHIDRLEDCNANKCGFGLYGFVRVCYPRFSHQSRH